MPAQSALGPLSVGDEERPPSRSPFKRKFDGADQFSDYDDVESNSRIPARDPTDIEFNRKYPSDAYGQEAGPNARVWRVYRDEVVGNDRSLIGGWNKTLDILLIFAALFSAVSTTFIVESYKMLQPDYTAYCAKLLSFTLSSRNVSGPFNAIENFASPDLFIPSTSSRWINGLWFLSLSISLAVSLLCILSKQWLEDYTARTSAPSPSSHDWSRRHAFYFNGITAWHLPTLLAMLPLLLHTALFFFFAGLVLFLLLLDRAIAYTVLTFTSLLAVFYVITIILPLFYAACPTRTAFTDHLHGFVHYLQRGTLHVTKVIFDTIFSSMCSLIGRHSRTMHVNPDSSQTSRYTWHDPYILVQAHHLDASIISWLFTTTPSSHVTAIAIQAVGALEPSSPALTRHITAQTKFLMLKHLGTVINDQSFDRYSTNNGRVNYARYLRTWFNLGSSYSRVDLWTKFSWIMNHKLPHDLQLLEFISCWMTRGMRWELDAHTAQAACLQSLRVWNYQHHPSQDGYRYPVGVYVRLTLDADNASAHVSTTLCISLHLFQACQMYTLPESDLAVVARHLSSLLTRLNVPFQFDLNQPLVACIETWSFVMNSSHDFFASDTDATIVARVLGILITRLRSKRLHQMPSQLPNFVRFLSSSRFVLTQWPLNTLTHILQLWDPSLPSHGLFLYMRIPWFSSVGGNLYAGRIFANMAHGVLRADDHTFSPAPIVSRIQAIKRLCHVFRMNTASMDSFPLVHAHPALPLAADNGCESVLCFLHHHEEYSSSAWRAFCVILDDDESRYSLLLVADALASHLFHMKSRDVDVTELVEEFFAEDWVSECIPRLLRSQVLDVIFERLAQHCAELSHHWVTTCEEILQDDAQSHDIQDRIHRLKDIVKWRGTCKYHGPSEGHTDS